MARNARSNGNRRDGGDTGTDSGSAPAVVSGRGDSDGDTGTGVTGGDGGHPDGGSSAAEGVGAAGGTGSGTGTGDSAAGAGRGVDDGSDTAGAGTGTGSVGDGSGSAVKRGRGRPRKDASNGAPADSSSAVRVRRERTPKPVGFAALGLGGESGNVKVRDAYVGGAKLIFHVPKYAGLGPHWSLDDDEAADLGAAIEAFVKTLPASQRKKWEKKLEKYWPGINLALVAGMITVPRVMATVELAKMARAANSPQPQTDAPAQTPYTGTRPAAFDLRDVIERSQGAAASADAPVPSGGAGEA